MVVGVRLSDGGSGSTKSQKKAGTGLSSMSAPYYTQDQRNALQGSPMGNLALANPSRNILPGSVARPQQTVLRSAPAQQPARTANPNSFWDKMRGFLGNVYNNYQNLTADAHTNQSQEEEPVEYPGYSGPMAPTSVYGKSIADFLAIATKQANSGIENQLAALAQQGDKLRGDAKAGDAQLAEMYAALRRQADKDAATNSQMYADAQTASKANTEQAQAALTGANAAVQNSQNELFNNLGINDGQNSVASQAQQERAKVNNSGVQANGNAAVQELIKRGATQGSFDRAMASAGDFAGASRRSDLQQALLSALAEISGRTAELKDSATKQATSLAQSMFNDDYNRWAAERNYQAQIANDAYQRYLDQRNYDTNRADTIWQQAYQENQLNAQNNQAPEYDDYTQQLMNLQNYSGGQIDSQRANEILGLINQGVSGATEQSGQTKFAAGLNFLKKQLDAKVITPEEFSSAQAALYNLTQGYAK